MFDEESSIIRHRGKLLHSPQKKKQRDSFSQMGEKFIKKNKISFLYTFFCRIFKHLDNIPCLPNQISHFVRFPSSFVKIQYSQTRKEREENDYKPHDHENSSKDNLSFVREQKIV